MGTPTTPTADPDLANWVRQLDQDAREYFEERAGIREHDGGFAKREAERLARLDTENYLTTRTRPQ